MGEVADTTLDKELRRLKYLLSGADLPGDGKYLAAPTSGRIMVEGATAPLLANHFVLGGSGLYVPERLAAGPAPIDLVQVYITARELFGVTPPLSLALDHLSRISFEEVAQFCAHWLNELHRYGADRRAVDAAYIETHLRGSARLRALALLRDPSRALVAAQGLFVVLKLATVYCGDAVRTGVEPGAIPLILPTVLQHMGAREQQGSSVITGLPGSLGREIISNQIFHAQRHPAGDIRRFTRRWIELPTELIENPRVMNMTEAFRDATGVDLADFVLLVLAMWGCTTDGRLRTGTSYFDSLGWSDERLQGALALFVNDVPHLRAAARDEALEHNLTWAIGTFERFPVMRMQDRSLLVLDPSLLARRVFGLLPLFDVTSALTKNQEKKKRTNFENSYAYLTEAYVHEVLAAAVPSSRLYGEAAIQMAYGTKRKNADAAVDYGDAWVVVEITTSRPQRGTVSGQSDAAVVADLDKLLAKATQLDATIASIRTDASRLTGARAYPHPRFYPVLIMAEGFPVNPISVTLLRERLAAAGVLQQPDTAQLEVLDLEELEMVESIQISGGGPSLLDLLIGHEASGTMRNVGLREYILLVLRIQPEQQYSGAMDRLVQWALESSPKLTEQSA
jgi:hypothetical protein